MRPARTFIAVLALALAASMALVPSSSSARLTSARTAAPAAERAPLSTGTSARAESAAARIGARVVKRRLNPGGPRQLMLVGAVRGAKGPVNIQRALSCNRRTRTCNFKYFKTVPQRQGRYQAVIDAPPRLRGWVWRAKIGNATSEAWVTCTKRPAQQCQIPYR
jgi:hypothetical protein